MLRHPTDKTGLGILRWLILLTTVTGIAAGSFHLSLGLTAKVDVFYVYYLGPRVFEPTRAQAVQNQHRVADPEMAYEMERRELQAINYPAIAAASYAAGKLVKSLDPAAYGDDGNYPRALAVAIGLSHLAVFLAGFLLAVTAVKRVPDFVAPFAVAVAVMALIGFVPGPSPSDHLLKYSGLEFVLNIVALLANPGEAFSPLSFWPKSSVAILLIAASALRWRGDFTAAYWLMACGFLFHINLTALVVLGYALIDASARPRVLFRPPTLLPILISVPMLALNPTPWQVLVDSKSVAVVVGVLVGLPVACYLAHRIIAPFAAKYDTMRMDVAMLVLAAAVAVPAFLAVYLVLRPQYLWGPESVWPQLASRLLVLVAGVVLFAACVLVVRWLERRLDGRSAATVVLVPIAFAAFATTYGAVGSWWKNGRYIVPLIAQLETTNLAEPLTRTYYQIVKALETGGPRDTASPHMESPARQ